MTWFEQALRCLLLITGFSLIILGANLLYSWIVALFDIDDLNDLDIDEDEVA